MLAAKIFIQLKGSGDRYQFGLQTLTKYSCRSVAAYTCQSASAECAVNMNIAIGEYFRAG